VNKGFFFATALVILALSNRAHSQTLVLKVVAKGTNDPIICKVVRITVDEKRIPLGWTDQTGQIKLPQGCSAGTFLLILPRDEWIYYAENIACSEASAGTVMLEKVTQPTVQRLAKQSTWDIDHPKIEEAVVANRIANELHSTGKEGGYEAYSVLIFAALLDVNTPFALGGSEKTLVISDSFKQRLTELQNGMGIPQTGVLDSSTLAAAQQIVRNGGVHALNATLDAGSKRIRRH
jgi:hypothetical protein